MRRPCLVFVLTCLTLAWGATGCAPDGPPVIPSKEPLTPKALSAIGLDGPTPVESVSAVVTPPAGWSMEPLKTSDRHTHQVWLSPSGRTAYGVIHFSLPIPVGNELLVWGFLHEMRRTEGEATLLAREAEPTTRGLRLVAEGGPYRVRTIVFSRGWQGWAIYAGTLRAGSIDPDELHLAEAARELTVDAMIR